MNETPLHRAGPASNALRKDGEGAFVIFIEGLDESSFPPPLLAVYADVDGGVTIDVNLPHYGAGIPMSVERATDLLVALGAAIAEARDQ